MEAIPEKQGPDNDSHKEENYTRKVIAMKDPWNHTQPNYSTPEHPQDYFQ